MMELLSSSSEKEAEADASREKVAISSFEELLRLCGLLLVGREEAMVIVVTDMVMFVGCCPPQFAVVDIVHSDISRSVVGF